MWVSTSVDLGNLKAKRSQMVEFIHKGILDIQTVVPTCSCSEAEHCVQDGNTIVKIVYTPTPVPEHFKLAKRFSYQSVKKIIVNTKDSSEVLTFTALIAD